MFRDMGSFVMRVSTDPQSPRVRRSMSKPTSSGRPPLSLTLSVSKSTTLRTPRAAEGCHGRTALEPVPQVRQRQPPAVLQRSGTQATSRSVSRRSSLRRDPRPGANLNSLEFQGETGDCSNHTTGPALHQSATRRRNPGVTCSGKRTRRGMGYRWRPAVVAGRVGGAAGQAHLGVDRIWSFPVLAAVFQGRSIHVD